MLRTLAKVMLAAMVGVALFEGFLWVSPFGRGISPVQYDQDIGMWHKPDFSSTVRSQCYSTRYFFDDRGRVANDYRPDDTKRDIVILGDSYVEAVMVDNADIVHNSLHDALHGAYNVYNYALAGTSAIQQYVILLKKVNIANTDAVIQIVNIDGDIYDVDPKNLLASSRPRVFMKFTSLDDFTIIPPRPLSRLERL
jgi:hypothetical protein